MTVNKDTRPTTTMLIDDFGRGETIVVYGYGTNDSETGISRHYRSPNGRGINRIRLVNRKLRPNNLRPNILLMRRVARYSQSDWQ